MQEYRDLVKTIVQLNQIKTIVDWKCQCWDLFEKPNNYINYIGIDSVVRSSDHRNFIHQEVFDPPQSNLLLMQNVTHDIIEKARKRADYILIMSEYSINIMPVIQFPYRLIAIRNNKMIAIVSGENVSLTDLKYNPQHDMSCKKTVLLAILARNKGHALNKYLDCIDRLNYDKDKITIYANTNNNTDNTKEILTQWIDEHRKEYANIIFESDDRNELAQDNTLPHGWNKLRCSVLGKIRNRSLKIALEQNCDYYFVVDCDNFLTNPYTLRELVAEEKPIIAPMLRCFPYNIYYSNYWCNTDVNGYYASHPNYQNILNYKNISCYEVPVVHCTYLIDSSVIPLLSYTEDVPTAGNYFEFAVFSRSAIKNNVKQYIYNKTFNGYIYLPKDTSSLENEVKELGNYLDGIN
jgi:hypothetical protein